ncbi:MAG: Fe-S cluster assembly protein SufB, partial [Candidatus Micrarchaeia archaeon]
MPEDVNEAEEDKEYAEKYGFVTHTEYEEFEKGISEEVVRKISKIKQEPEWMLEKRLIGYRLFKDKSMPKWGPDLSGIDFENIQYYRAPKASKTSSWEEVPVEIK